jgi:crotonobetainyl-CoA:carnitine CoA-transferase CaiB-like acyl-CoA transferase
VSETTRRVNKGSNEVEDHSDESLPLAGIRVIAIEQLQAMPFATQLLAWLGADVVKIEPLAGEAGRSASPSLTDVDGESVGATYLRNNLAKRTLSVDLKNPQGRELVLEMIGNFDVLAENFKPGSLSGMGLGYDDVHRRHPDVVYASVSGFGNDDTSPYREWPAYAPIVEAMAGFYDLRREEGSPPKVGLGAAFGDICAAMFAAVGILAGMHKRDRTGIGEHVDVAMFDAMIAFGDMISFMPSMGVLHPVRQPRGIVNAFAAADGYFVIAVLREHQFARLANLIGSPGWLTDPRLSSRTDWVAHLDDLIRPAIETWARDLTRLEACNILASEGIAAGPSYTEHDIRSDPHVLAHQMLLEVDRPDTGGPLVISGQPIRFSESNCVARGRWPQLGEHTDSLLQDELGISSAGVDELRKMGVVR